MTVTRTGLFLKRQIWVWPVIAVVVLSIIGFYVRGSIESTMKDNLKSELTTLLDAETAMLMRWFKTQQDNAESVANELSIREYLYPLLEVDAVSAKDAEQAVKTQELQSSLDRALHPLAASHDFMGYFVTDRSSRIIASSHASLVGQAEVAEYMRFVSRALDGETVVSAPFSSVVMLKSKRGDIRTGEPTMYVCAPIRDPSFQVVGAMALQLDPEDEFTEILQLGRMGDSGETYAFDQQGRMVSNSRFDRDLILLGLIPDNEHARSILNVLVRTPEGDMTQGFRPKVRRAELPLTLMAQAAINGNQGVNVDGYRDYRGVPVVGAWKWLAEYEIGVATEIDVAEAFRPLTILKRTFWALYGLLVASSVAIFVFTVVVARLQRDARRAAIEAQKLGQYTLEAKLGAGAMGVVYRGHHAMLRRPTAIKLLDDDKLNEASIQRFEREVQITCNLNHPSTVQIYDYGRTPEGVFYYAMEFLDGIDLQELIERFGPQPAGRVIHILRQACGSLYEAHSKGLVHRDIKPANMMLNRRGGESDVVKVLDFGLVKTIDDREPTRTRGGSMTGTPLYMSPEAIQSPMSVDGRSDLYGIGAVGYYLLTGTTVFRAETLMQLCQKHIDETPESPSKRLGKPLSSELENAILSCLEKNRAQRPQTARDLAKKLARCPEADTWDQDHAETWWGHFQRGQVPVTSEADSRAATSSSSSDEPPSLDQTIATD